MTTCQAEEPLVWGTRRARWVVAASVLGSGMAAIDATVVNIALPTIGRDLHAGLSSLQWVVTGYTLALTALLLLGGSLGDVRGHRTTFAVGVAWFTVASALCAVAPTSGLLIAARVLQGVGGALLTPSSLALLQASFTGADKAKAIAAWSGLGALSTAAGPLLGGWLLSFTSWRAVFLINLPLGAAVLLLTREHVPAVPPAPDHPRLDLVGVALAGGALTGLTYAAIEGPSQGWGDPLVVASLVLLAVCGPAFVEVEQHRAHPVLPLTLFADRGFRAANGLTLLLYGALSTVLFLLPVQLQTGSGYSPLQAGLALLPVTACLFVLSGPSGRLAARRGPWPQLVIGPLLAGVGLLLLARVPAHPSYVLSVGPAALVLGLGLACTVAPLTSTALSTAPPELGGAASAVNNDLARAGGLLAVALVPPLVGLGGAAYRVPAELASGFVDATRVAGGLCLLAALVAFSGSRAGERRARHRVAVDAPVTAAAAQVDGHRLLGRPGERDLDS